MSLPQRPRRSVNRGTSSRVANIGAMNGQQLMEKILVPLEKGPGAGRRRRKNKKNAKAKVVNQPRAIATYTTAQPISKSEVNEMIEQKLNEAHHRVDISEPGAKLMSSLHNPFDVSEPLPVVSGIPDGCNKKSVKLHVYGSCTFSAGTTTSVITQLLPCNFVSANTFGEDFFISKGADAEDPSVMMTSVDKQFSDNYVSLGATLGTSTCSMRIVRMGIHAVPISPPQETAGTFRGWCTDKYHRTGAAVWVANGDMYNNTDFKLSNAADGMTVTRRIASIDTFKLISSPPVAQYTTGTYKWGPVPCLMVSGMSSTTKIKFSWDYTVEWFPNGLTVLDAQVPEYEPELEQLIHLYNELPYITTGHSFKSFMSNVWKAGKKARQWYIKNQDNIKVAAEAVSGLVSTVL